MEKAKPFNLNRPAQWKWLIALSALFGLAVLSACGGDTSEAALRAQLQEMREAASEGKPGDFMQGVTADFTGNQGMNRAALHNLLRMQTMGSADIGTVTGPLEVEINGERATVRFTAVLTGGRGRFMPDSAQVYAISSGWRIEEGKWRLYYAEWKPNP
jgi:hypothetical protein